MAFLTLVIVAVIATAALRWPGVATLLTIPAVVMVAVALYNSEGDPGEDEDTDERWVLADCSPRLRGVTTWTNLFTEGDYVGRRLWWSGSFEGLKKREVLYRKVPDHEYLVAETIVAGGAHVQYFENREVARHVLDLALGVPVREAQPQAAAQRAECRAPASPSQQVEGT